MIKKQLHAVILIWLCMLMQAVSVFPHHHHAHALYMGHGHESGCPVRDSRRCTSECITHFTLTLPSYENITKAGKQTEHPHTVFRRTHHFILAQILKAKEHRYGTRPTGTCPSPPGKNTGMRAPPPVYT